MDKVKVKEIAEELGIKSKEVVEKAADIGLEVKAANSSVTPEEAEKLMNYVLTGEKEEPKEDKPKPASKKAKVEPKKEEPKQEVKATPKKEVVKEKPVEKETPKKETLSKPKPELKKVVEKVEPKPVKEEVKAVEPTKVEPVSEPVKEKTEEPKAEPKKESLASVSVRKRRGLVIVKKKRPVKVEADPKNFPSPYAKKKNSQPLESVFGSASQS